MPECEDDVQTAALWWRSKWDYTDLLSELVEMKLALRMSGYISKSGKRTKKWDEEFDKLVEKALDTQQSIIIRKFLNSPQFKKQYAKLSVVEKVLRGLPVWQDDFQLEKVLNLIRRTE